MLALLGGGLICLLVVNTSLGATSFRISQLQTDNANLSVQEQTLLGRVAKERSPQGVEERAYQLGMRTPQNSDILDLRTHKFARVPGHAGAQGQDSTATPSAGSKSAAVGRAAHPKRVAASPGTTNKAGSSR